jgi:hypothetical protein
LQDDTLEEADLKSMMRSGTVIRELMAIERNDNGSVYWVIYVRSTHHIGWRILMTWIKSEIRRFGTFVSILRLRDRLGYRGPLTIRFAHSPELLQMRGVLIADGGSAPGPVEKRNVRQMPSRQRDKPA